MNKLQTGLRSNEFQIVKLNQKYILIPYIFLKIPSFLQSTTVKDPIANSVARVSGNPVRKNILEKKEIII